MTVGTLTAPAPLPCPAAWPRQDVPGFPRRDRCLIMGIVNVTPDSFSDGGTHLAAASAIQHGLALARSGADIIDVGGESTRPGASRVAAAEELRRVLPVIRELSAAGLTVTIDTTRSLVAEAALAAGTTGINDVSGGLADPAMARLAAEAHVPYIAMHWRGLSRHAAARGLRRCRHRGHRRAPQPAGIAPPASTASSSCSTPASASPNGPRTTGSC